MDILDHFQNCTLEIGQREENWSVAARRNVAKKIFLKTPTHDTHLKAKFYADSENRGPEAQNDHFGPLETIALEIEFSTKMLQNVHSDHTK